MCARDRRVVASWSPQRIESELAQFLVEEFDRRHYEARNLIEAFPEDEFLARDPNELVASVLDEYQMPWPAIDTEHPQAWPFETSVLTLPAGDGVTSSQPLPRPT